MAFSDHLSQPPLISFLVTKRYCLSGASWVEMQNFDYELHVSVSSPELLLSSQFLMYIYGVPLGGFSGSPLLSTLLASKLPFPQDGCFDLMNQLQGL